MGAVYSLPVHDGAARFLYALPVDYGDWLGRDYSADQGRGE